MILDVKNLNVYFKDKKKDVQILDDISFQLKENTCLGFLGDSGSGKSMAWKALTGMLDDNFRVEGTAVFKDVHLLHMNKKQKRDIRGKDITVVVQNPMTAFDPLFTIENQMIETFRNHKNMSKKEAKDMALDVINRLKINGGKDILGKYPHELSGGMLQRIMIGIAIALDPALIIADEPTTAIDSINQAEVIKEFVLLRKNLNVSMIFITHDLGVLSQIADEIIVLKKGRIVEKGTVEEIVNNPNNQETKHLVGTRSRVIERFKVCIRGGESL